jgi:Domain of unknown function (DUF4380)
VTFLGWSAHEVQNGLVRAVVVPDIGGRVLQFWLDDHPFLFVNQSLAGRLFSAEDNWGDGTIASWKNYGGNKTWPAPQGWSGPDEWAGPPDPVLDSGRFKTLSADASRVVVQSPPDPRTGLQITRELILEPGAARAILRRTMRNLSNRAVRWSLWDVTQLDCAIESSCRMSTPLNQSSCFPGGYSVLYGPRDNAQWRIDRPGVFSVEYARALGKVALDSQAGWIAFSDGEWALLHQFEVEPGGDYPDGGATVEVWTQGPGVAAGVDFGQPQLRGEFMEMEVLGPLQRLSPGEQASADLIWSACRCPGGVVDATTAGCVSDPLRVEPHGETCHVTGTFGVFAPGRAQLRIKGTANVLIDRVAGPLQPVVLDDEIAVPRGAALELVVVGNVSGQIAGVEVSK